MNHLHGTHDMAIVFLSYIIAVAASYTALDLAGRVSAAKGRGRRALWLVGGATSMGFGIWSMHFVGMLAFQLSVPIAYDFVLVLLSILVAFLASLIALYVVRSNELKLKQLMIGGLLMAAGIVAMHYIGMAAMRVGIYYEPGLFMLSIVIAIVASIAALWLSFYFRKVSSWKGVIYKLGSGMLMGAAIAGMHYTGMAAARFHEGNGTVILSEVMMNQQTLAYLIAGGTFLVLAFSLLGVFIDKRFSRKADEFFEQDKWYKSLYENHEDGIITVGIEGRIIAINPSAIRILGIDAHKYLQQNVGALLELHYEEQRVEVTEMFRTSLAQGEVRRIESVVIHGEGHDITLEGMSVPVIIDGEVKGTYILFRDISEEKRRKETIQHLAFHDELTGLPNRRLLKRTLEGTIDQASTSDDPLRFAVLFMDIDRFKLINDSLGHAYGDLFLQMVAERLRQAAEGFHVTLARMGGDEFTMICYGEQIEELAVQIAQRIIDTIQIPYRLVDNDFYVSASIGIAIYPDQGVDAEQLLKNADTAMYQVKRNGKNDYQFYSSLLDGNVLEKIELEGALRKAIERNELLVHYQPQFNLRDERLIGVEALLRWNHPVKGLIPPGVFIPIAEETGLIREIGAWVLREACQQMQQWQQQYHWNIPVSVNLSTQQFHQEHLARLIESILAETKLDPAYLELEITESMMMDADRSTQILRDLTELGVRISMDDFGTGYSSLSYLKMFPIHSLKIDRSFIKDLMDSEDDRAIVATIIAMAHNLKMNVIAEGVETEEQLQFLTENDCDDIQGFYFSKPLSVSDVERVYLQPLGITTERAEDEEESSGQ
jgi:diguanylate cyclase (GGDEF)-like protein/PAS domain S-box-containing protein